MEVYINHSGGLHKLKHGTELPNDRIQKNEGIAKIYFDTPSFYLSYLFACYTFG
ncbi:MAG: hypothetical protein SOZ18_02070 [Phocaeicola sp.]|nr:hypothetical protein [Phocaeicola sp.]